MLIDLEFLFEIRMITLTGRWECCVTCLRIGKHRSHAITPYLSLDAEYSILNTFLSILINDYLISLVIMSTRVNYNTFEILFGFTSS